MKQIKVVIFLVIVFFVYSCKTEMYVTNTSKTSINNNVGVIYALPKTKLNILLELTEIHKQKGPFAKYTHLYFNAKNAIEKDETKYIISNISINTNPVLDSANIYKINNSDNKIANLINLTQDGFIAGINLTDYQSEKLEIKQNKISNFNTNNKVLDYANFSVNSIRETQYDTIYKEVMQDSILVKIPIIKKKEVFKSLQKQAKETADVLFLLRDDRNALLKGENDGNNFPDGNALQLMLNELNKLEKNYMSLFTGREIKIKKQYSFEIIPNNSSENKIYLFSFSNKKGFINKETKKYNSVYINFETNNNLIKTSKFKQANILSIKNTNNTYAGIIYRIPENINTKIIMGKSVLYKKNIKISQAGTLNIISSNIFKEGIKVEFYPEYGSLKRISKIKTK